LSKLWIKICGITRNSDAIAAVASGADAIGLVFYAASPRAVSKDRVEEITDGIVGKAQVVALFVDAQEEEVNKVLETNRIDLLQFHGSESAQYCESFGLPYMKAFRVNADNYREQNFASYDSAQMILLDSYSELNPGGTGKVFDWRIGRKIKVMTEMNIVVAGGLSPDNVKAAIEQIHPFGIDVSSGVEQDYGIKDLTKVSAFIEGARSV